MDFYLPSVSRDDYDGSADGGVNVDLMVGQLPPPPPSVMLQAI